MIISLYHTWQRQIRLAKTCKTFGRDLNEKSRTGNGLRLVLKMSLLSELGVSFVEPLEEKKYVYFIYKLKNIIQCIVNLI